LNADERRNLLDRVPSAVESQHALVSVSEGLVPAVDAKHLPDPDRPASYDISDLNGGLTLTMQLGREPPSLLGSNSLTVSVSVSQRIDAVVSHPTDQRGDRNTETD
jgi:hypothetical protein